MKAKTLHTPSVPRPARELAKRLRTLLGDNVLEIRLYGSQTSGEATSDSDIDVSVIMQQADLNTWQAVHKEAAYLSLEHDTVLSVRLLSSEEWGKLQKLQTLYARTLQEEGITL